MKHFYVIVENNGVFQKYDVIPYLIKEFKKLNPKNKNLYWGHKTRTHIPKTKKDFKEFILAEAQYMWWARCEYEMILSDWPCKKVSKKIDVFDQIKMNIDVVVDILYYNINVLKI